MVTLTVAALIAASHDPRSDRASYPTRSSDLPTTYGKIVLHQRHDITHAHLGRDINALVAAIKTLRKSVARNRGAGRLAAAVRKVSPAVWLGCEAAPHCGDHGRRDCIFSTASRSLAMAAAWLRVLDHRGKRISSSRRQARATSVELLSPARSGIPRDLPCRR